MYYQSCDHLWSILLPIFRLFRPDFLYRILKADILLLQEKTKCTVQYQKPNMSALSAFTSLLASANCLIGEAALNRQLLGQIGWGLGGSMQSGMDMALCERECLQEGTLFLFSPTHPPLKHYLPCLLLLLGSHFPYAQCTI